MLASPHRSSNERPVKSESQENLPIPHLAALALVRSTSSLLSLQSLVSSIVPIFVVIVLMRGSQRSVKRTSKNTSETASLLSYLLTLYSISSTPTKYYMERAPLIHKNKVLEQTMVKDMDENSTSCVIIYLQVPSMLT